MAVDMSTVLMRVSLRVRPDQRELVLKAIRQILGPTGVARGCLSCHAYMDLEDENSILHVEEWANPEDLRARLCDDTFRVLLSALDLSCGSPGLQFSTVTESKGIELVEEVWKNRKPNR
jgi:quinol monooxygenase YgiN